MPTDFPAPLLAVIHISERANCLAEVIQSASALKIIDPVKPTPLRSGNVYLAPANRHLVVKSGCAVAVMGPRENRHRPSVDTLFRSAARAYRRSVVAVVLSGALDDGAAGALAVKARGGMVIVQDPEEAEVPDMPRNVMKQLKPDRCLTLDQMPGALAKLAAAGTPELPEVPNGDCALAAETAVAKQDEPLAFTCPECGGALLQTQDGKRLQWRCHVGHRFSLESFSEAHADAVERALWVALRKLRERQSIHEQLARNADMPADMRRRFKENGAAAAGDIKLLEEVMTRL